ncbi:acetyltransferase [Drechmeria coniospora]|uniref:Acetyltransferase n=1 Tax=Drechmeria coniospora TaxID=98403 RepID=A0A151GMA5_DRECN|nr:acetyltransferase [Drechmeria coniospora]KYK58122.1 acetyltransferase [Drechmeria coniospora]ODA83039.1 hypothetical protein RJ55_01548 [Drechmeria coniospora]
MPSTAGSRMNQSGNGETANIARPAEELVDDKLTLRRWRADDADSLYAAASSSLAELGRWMPWAAKGYSKDDADRFLRFTTGAWDADEEYDYAIVDDGRVSGSCGLIRRIGPDALEIGYWLAADATGRGLATRAASLLVDAAFLLPVDRVQIRHDRRNVRSEAIPRRLGFRCLGQQASPAPPETDIVWQLDRPRKQAA